MNAPDHCFRIDKGSDFKICDWSDIDLVVFKLGSLRHSAGGMLGLWRSDLFLESLDLENDGMRFSF